MMFRHHVYGIVIESDFELASLAACTASAPDTEVVLTVGSDDFFHVVTEGLTFNSLEWRQQIVLGDGALYMRFEDLLEFVVSRDGQRIVWRKLGEAEPVAFEASLLNFALGAALLQQGEEPLHCTVVDLGLGAVGLLGASGAGKSTLAAFLIAQGGALVTDDILRVTFEPEVVLAQPGPDRLKLFEEPALRYLPGAVSRGRFNPLSGKYMFQPTGASHCQRHARPLAALFQLGESPDVLLTPILGASFAKTILSSTLMSQINTPTRLARQFGFIDRMARRLPVHALTYPRAYSVLDQVANKIRGTLAS